MDLRVPSRGISTCMGWWWECIYSGLGGSWGWRQVSGHPCDRQRGTYTLCAYVCVCLWVHTHLWHSLSVLTLGTGCGEWGQVEEDDLRKGWQSITIAFPGEYSGIGDEWVRVMEGILIWGAREAWTRILVPNISIYLLLHLSSYHSINHPSLHMFISMHVLSISLPTSIHLSSYLAVIYLSVYLYLSVFYSCLSTYLSIIHLSICIYIYLI